MRDEDKEKQRFYIVLLITFIIFLIKNLALVFNLWNQENFLRKMII